MQTHFDLVLLCPHPRGSTWQIPDLERQAWIFADPDKQGALLKKASLPIGGVLHRYVRLIKRWNMLQHDSLKSYYLEVMCYDAFRERPDSFMGGFEALCGHLAEKVLRRQENPAGLGPNIDDHADPFTRQERQRRLLEVQRIAANALSYERQGRVDDAHREWRKVFGDVYVF